MLLSFFFVDTSRSRDIHFSSLVLFLVSRGYRDIPSLTYLYSSTLHQLSVFLPYLLLFFIIIETTMQSTLTYPSNCLKTLMLLSTSQFSHFFSAISNILVYIPCDNRFSHTPYLFTTMICYVQTPISSPICICTTNTLRYIYSRELNYPAQRVIIINKTAEMKYRYYYC